jgi:hypothetical protein
MGTGVRRGERWTDVWHGVEDVRGAVPLALRAPDPTVTYQFNNTAIGFTISRTNTSGSGGLVAGLNLPEGALVTEIAAVFCDTSATKFFQQVLWSSLGWAHGSER